MTKQDLAAQLARESHRSEGKAADKIDQLVHKMMKEQNRRLTNPTLFGRWAHTFGGASREKQ